jgi:uncharacterized protein (DUF2141 family)
LITPLLSFFLFIGSITGLADYLEKPVINSLQVRITNIEQNEGMIRLALFAQEKGFPGDTEHALRTLSLPAEEPELLVSLEGLPAGSYALAVLHDRNENGRMDTNLLGYPTESYGFSNEAYPLFRAPRFEEAAFQLSHGVSELEIPLR